MCSGLVVAQIAFAVVALVAFLIEERKLSRAVIRRLGGIVEGSEILAMAAQVLPSA